MGRKMILHRKAHEKMQIKLHSNLAVMIYVTIRLSNQNSQPINIDTKKIKKSQLMLVVQTPKQ